MTRFRRLVFVLTFVLGVGMSTPTGATPRPPHLGPIIAILVPPDQTRPVTAWCDGQVSPPKDDQALKDLRRQYPPLLNGERCTTYYFVRIPEEVGSKLKVEWRLEGNRCGRFNDAKHVYDRYGTDDHVAYATWFHPHTSQATDVKTPCVDQQPHPGTIVFEVLSPKWVCTARYGKGSKGTEFPDTHGESSVVQPRQCTSNT